VRPLRGGALAVATLLLAAGCAGPGSAAGADARPLPHPAPAPTQPSGPPGPSGPGPEGRPGPVAPEAGKPAPFVEEKLDPAATVLLRHRTGGRRLLVYAGAREEETSALSDQGTVEPVSALSWKLVRRHVVAGAGEGAPAELVSNSIEELAAATQAGRDALESLRGRPSGGRRIFAGVRRLSERGAEPLGSDRSAEQRLEPFLELPRLPRKALAASAPLVEAAGPYRVEWRLAGAGTLAGRECWRAIRTVATPADARVPSGEALDFEDEFIVAAADSTVLRARRTSRRVGGLGRLVTTQLELVEEKPEAEAAVRRERDETEGIVRLLAAIAGRRPDEAARAADELARQGLGGSAVELARRFAAGEKALAEPAGGARRIELVPEDTFVLVRAPAKVPAGAALVPVVFFHGAGAGPARYFEDWAAKAGDRPLLLVFPQSRDWTWQIDSDAAVVGSLLERLGRTYRLDRERLVLAGHGMGAELAFALGYGAEFPGFRVRGIVAAGGTMSQKDPNMKRLRSLASDGRHEELAARVRSTDVLALAGEEDKLYALKDFQNTDRWLKSFNPKGVELLSSPKLGQQYSPEWTPVILDWVAKLGPLSATNGHP